MCAQAEKDERALTELYGPLLFEVESSRLAIEDVFKTLKRDRVFPLSDEELKFWLFRAENDLMPRNARMAAIAREKIGLAEDVGLKAQAALLLEHEASWRERHAKWKKDGTPYEWKSATPFPRELGTSLRAGFAALKKRHAEALAKDSAAAVRWTERQIRELYEPLVRLNAQGLAAVKGYSRLNTDDADQARWKVWAERSFLPRNEETRRAIANAVALVDGEALSEPFLAFLEHQLSWSLLHLRWEKEKVDYAWGSRTNWPVAFSMEVEAAYQILLDRRARLVVGQK